MNKIKKIDWFVIFAIVILYSYSFFYRIDEVVVAPFRESQTGITIYYILKHSGFDFNYITPVLGYPWKVPFEFPMYQLIVALITPNFNLISLTVTSKLVSILFLCGSIFIINLILKIYDWDFISRKNTIFIILISPVYLVYSTSISIESTAVLAGLLAYYFFLQINPKTKITKIVLSCFFSVLCVLSKSTTWVIFATIIGCTILFNTFSGIKDIQGYRCAIKIYIKNTFNFIIILGFPLLIGMKWIAYTDEIKSLSSLSNSFTSTNLISWNYGSYDQWISPGYWFIIFIKLIFMGSITLPIITLKNIINKNLHANDQLVKLILFLSFIIPIILFSNLYYRHDYYFFATTIFFIIFMSSFINWEDVRKALLYSCILISLSISAVYLTLKKNYYIPADLEVISFIKSEESKDPIIIIGRGYSSYIPYMTERRALMLNDVSDIILSTNFVDDNKIINWSAVIVKSTDLESYNKLSLLFNLDLKNKYVLSEGDVIFSKNKINNNYESDKRVSHYIERCKSILTKDNLFLLGPLKYINFQIFDNNSFSPKFEILILRSKSLFYIDLFSPIILRFGAL